ncbi:hypothetical protein KUW19_00760 [Ferrimonas balearica]|uniref:hypothetical protein n=1 Tax=Ferrimonas balearica TaxID=44012 RepID=UPI001C961BE2|nr:hypothetical protein [Ferrimonas balearica]MBY6105007.1 hypothetical protein [Ferrimonas balearica]
MAVSKTKQIRSRADIIGTPALDFYFKLVKARCQETLELMADRLEKDFPKHSEDICVAFEVRLIEIGGREY